MQKHMKLCRKNNIINNAKNHKGTLEEKYSHIETPKFDEDQGKTPQGGKPFQIILLIRLSLNFSVKREYNNLILYLQYYPKKTIQKISQI